MIDTSGRCTICQQQIPIGVLHTCSGVPYVAGTGTWPSPPLASATTDDILAELQKIRALLTTPPQACLDAIADLRERIQELERLEYGDPKDE